MLAIDCGLLKQLFYKPFCELQQNHCEYILIEGLKEELTYRDLGVPIREQEQREVKQRRLVSVRQAQDNQVIKEIKALRLIC